MPDPFREASLIVPHVVSRADVRRLVEQGAQLVEVLPRDEYEYEHLPRAISLPLEQLDAQSLSRLDRARPVIVYCWDGL
jgi:rhodanese-related sulfurtransferase